MRISHLTKRDAALSKSFWDLQRGEHITFPLGDEVTAKASLSAQLILSPCLILGNIHPVEDESHGSVNLSHPQLPGGSLGRLSIRWHRATWYIHPDVLAGRRISTFGKGHLFPPWSLLFFSSLVDEVAHSGSWKEKAMAMK